MNAITSTTSTTDVILERNQRLSRSMVWQLQQNFYNHHGVEAWRQGTVPHYITSNPFIANAYAKVVIGFLQDCQSVETASEQSTFAPLDPKQPIYIVELGAGSGRFSYHFLKIFHRLHQDSTLEAPPFKYIMTDLAEKTIDYWLAHASLRPFIEAGILDFARFEIGQNQTLVLRHSGDHLSPEKVKNPMVILANYIFDSVPQDCFYIKGHRIFESLVTIASPREEPDLTDPTLIERIKITYEHKPTIASYYEEGDLNQLLRDYQHQLHETTLLFPRAALDSIRHFCHLSKGRLLLLSGDKGYIREEALEGWEDQELTVHGSFSMMVNYHAIAQYVRNLDGQVLQMTYKHDSLNVSAFLIGQHPKGYRETGQAYQEAIDRFGPDDFFVLKEGIQQCYTKLAPQQIIAYLKLSHWDASIFLDLFSDLHENLTDASESLKKSLREAAQSIWDLYYPIGETNDVAFQLGMLLYRIDYYADALVYFQHSLQLHGPHPSTFYNLSLCYYGMKQWVEALKWAEETLELDSAFEGGKALWEELREKLRQSDEPLAN